MKVYQHIFLQVFFLVFVVQNVLAHEIELEAIVVDDDPILDSGVKPYDIITEYDFDVIKRDNISDSLENVLGVSSTKFGPNASRPIIRGQDGDRVRLNENGTIVQDWSVSSFDHALPVNPNILKQIEIIRGPAAVMFGGNAMGGTINFVNNRIPKNQYDQLGGITEFSITPEHNASSGFFELNGGDGDGLSWHLDGSILDKGLTKTPTFTDNGEEPVRGNKIRNSKIETKAFGGGFSIQRGSRLIGFSVDNYQSEYGVPKLVNHKLDVNKTTLNVLYDERLDLGLIQRVKAKAKYTDYQHDEFDLNFLETKYKRDSTNARVELFTETAGGISGILGFELINSRNPVISFAHEEEEHEEEEEEGHEEHANLGPIPTTKNKAMGVFAYQYKKINDSLMEFGFRIDDVEAKADSIHEIEEFGNATTAGEVHAEGGLTKSFTPKSVSLGLTQDLGEGFKIHSSASYVERAPSFYELFTGGVHHTTNLYEQGNVNLKKETGKHYDLGLSYEERGFKVRANIFQSDYKNYITLVRSGTDLFYAEHHHHEEEHEEEEHEEEESEVEEVEIYNYTGVDSDFKGIEFSASKKIMLDDLTITPTFSYDQVIGKRKGSSDYLPRITPKRISLYADISGINWFIRPEFRYIYSGNKGLGEITETEGYKLFNLYAQYQLENDWSLFLKGYNLTNELAFSATTVEAVRYFAPLPGQSVLIGVKKFF
ncbi:MAG: hypothetical protein CMK52_05195 [Proteobacteria bacterium]|nr:hypothetical protein [Pseudomonadota bacterium]